MLFGSYSRNEQRIDSDVDICIYFDLKENKRFNTRLLLLGFLNEKYDIQPFQGLPIYVKMEVLKGNLLYCKDYSFFYDIAYNTIEEYNLFEQSYKLYLYGD